MAYHYLAFGIAIISEIELPALFPLEDETLLERNPVHVKLGMVPSSLSNPGGVAGYYGYGNALEMLYIFPNRIKFYITNGNNVIIEPISENKGNFLLFYSVCLTAVVYQRNLIPFHVSGVFLENGKVALFAAPSRTGKSTLAVKLLEMGYQPFTDDTAVLFFEKGKCYAQASYPMMRLWQNSVQQQSILQESDKQKLYEDEDQLDKYGFSFRQQFVARPAEVQQIVFLQKAGTEIQIKPVRNVEAFIALSNNVFGNSWISAMQKSKLQFELVSQILNTVPCIQATRPECRDSFDEFPLAIKNILQKNYN